MGAAHKEEMLRALLRLMIEREARVERDAQLAADVALARASGASWEKIGDALGVTRSAVWQRYGRPVKPAGTDPESALF